MRRQRAPRSEEATNERIEAFKAALKRASEERAEALAAKESAENACQRQFTRLTQEIERNESRIHELLRQNVEMELKYVRGDGAFDAVVERIKEGMREDIRTRRDVHGIIDRRACTDPREKKLQITNCYYRRATSASTASMNALSSSSPSCKSSYALSISSGVIPCTFARMR